jgi:DNA-binding LacI/PurR family transcriptional regulator
MVIVDRPAFYTEANIAFVYADNYRGSALMAEHFCEEGIYKFVCFAGPV